MPDPLRSERPRKLIVPITRSCSRHLAQISPRSASTSGVADRLSHAHPWSQFRKNGLLEKHPKRSLKFGRGKRRIRSFNAWQRLTRHKVCETQR